MACALLISLGEYQNMDPLPSAKVDIGVLHKLCRTALNIDGAKITELTGELEAPFFEKMVTQFCKDNADEESFVFYYSGHGGTSIIGDNAVFTMYGTDGGQVALPSVLKILEDSFPHGLIILDSCSSGSASICEASYDFLEHSSKGYTLIASSEKDECSYAGAGDCPSIFTGVLKVAFDCFYYVDSPYCPVSSAIEMMNCAMGVHNSAELNKLMHPIVHNMYACDGGFKSRGKVFEKSGPYLFNESNIHFVVNNMNSNDYRRARVSVLLGEDPTVQIEEVLPILESTEIQEEMEGNPLFENEKEERRLANKPLTSIVFNVFPNSIDLLINNPKWRVYWENNSVLHIRLDKNTHLKFGSLSYERLKCYEDLKQSQQERCMDKAALASVLSSLYVRTSYLMEKIGSAFNRVLNGGIDDSELMALCAQNKKLADKVTEDALNLPYSIDSSALESDINHLIGMAGAISSFVNLYTGDDVMHTNSQSRLCQAGAFLEQCAESHRGLFS